MTRLPSLHAFVLRVALLAALALPVHGRDIPPPDDGVDVGRPSALRNLVPAGQLEQRVARDYAALKREAAARRALAPHGNAGTRRLRAIAQRMIPHAASFNARAGEWQWEVNLIGSDQINAFCMPGGKIAFFTGLLNGLRLTDDEAAVVMGHEIAHALREHARARLAKTHLTEFGTILLGELVANGRYSGAFRAGGNLLTLKFSRDDETEADAVGLELAARAGYHPRAGLSLWKKMSATGHGAPPRWLSTHPSGPERIREIEHLLPRVMPIYEASAARG